MFHRFPLALLAAIMPLVMLVRADFPECSLPCLGQAPAGDCSYTDNACMCQNTDYVIATNNCFRDSCSAADWKTAYDYSVYLCNQAGVTQPIITDPPTKRTAAAEVKRTFVPVQARHAAGI